MALLSGTRREGSRSRALLSVASAGLLSALSACASIWGFQEPTDLNGEAGADATTEAAAAEASNEGASVETGETDAARDAPQESAALDAGSGSDADADADAADARVAPDGPPTVCNASCVPAAPSGWEGPVAIYTGPSPAPSCAEAGTGAFSTYVFSGNDQLGAPDASCTCNCGAPEGGACGAAVANYFSNNSCTTGCGTSNQAIQTTCTPLGASGCTGTHFSVAEPVPQGGTCAPAATTTVPPSSWGEAAEGCEAPPQSMTSEGCDAGELCMPEALGPFDVGNYCVVLGGSQPCPAGSPYQVHHTYYSGSTDSRGCTPCTCGAPTGATCTGGTFTAYGSTTCSGGTNSFALPVACGNLGGSQGGSITGVTYQPGSCAPSGGQPTGSVQPTVCCLH